MIWVAFQFAPQMSSFLVTPGIKHDSFFTDILRGCQIWGGELGYSGFNWKDGKMERNCIEFFDKQNIT